MFLVFFVSRATLDTARPNRINGALSILTILQHMVSLLTAIHQTSLQSPDLLHIQADVDTTLHSKDMQHVTKGLTIYSNV
jgi:hypothetical protein